jgi:transposase InsO family protein
MTAVGHLGKEIGIARACRALEVPRATFYRKRKTAVAVIPKARRAHARKLSEEEQTEIKTLLYSEPMVDKSPYQVFAKLLDERRYVCSIRSMYRILAKDQASRERRRQLRHPNYTKPELLATRPNQVWSWDITKLLGPKKWTYFYLYVILDIYSRYVVGWMLARREAQELAARLIRETTLRQRVRQDELTLHSDRGPSMKSQQVSQLLATLGVTKSHSRPHISNDNPFSESQFKTLKYRPEFPERFESLEAALAFSRRFFKWYNEEHYHTGIGLLTPSSLHHGRGKAILEDRHKVLCTAYDLHPERFPLGRPKPKAIPEAVWINPPSSEPQKEEAGQDPRIDIASSTHHRPGYPSTGCVPAVPASVSPSVPKTTEASPGMQAFEHRSHALKIPGDWGLAPKHQNQPDLSGPLLTN